MDEPYADDVIEYGADEIAEQATVTSPLTAEFMMGAIVGILRRNRFVSGAIVIGVVGLSGLVLAIIYVTPMLSLATSQYLEAWRVVIFGFPCALIIYALTAIEHLHPSVRGGNSWSLSAIGRTPLI